MKKLAFTLAALQIAVWAMMATPAMADGTTAVAQPAEEIDEVEEIEEIEEVRQVAVAQADGSSEEPSFIGRLHPGFVHFPIAWVLLLLLLELGTFVFNRIPEKMGRYMGVLTVLSFLPALISGHERIEEMETLGHVPSQAETHEEAALVTFGVVIFAVALRWIFKGKFNKPITALYLLALTVAVLLVMTVGHIGGTMVFGANYLPF